MRFSKFLTARLPGFGAAGLALILATSACGRDGNVQMAVSAAQGSALSTPSGELVQEDGSSTLTLSSVRIVIEEVELERVDGSCDASDRDRDDCGEFETGPFVLDLPLDGSVVAELAANIAEGQYDEIEFEIDDLDDNDALLADYPELEDTSIEVTGTFNGEAFTFRTDLNSEQELDLDPPLVVDENASGTTLTVSIDVSSWFVDAQGAIIDPRSANEGGPNEELVESNIRRSFDGFEDDDRDGRDDYDDDDDDEDDDDDDDDDGDDDGDDDDDDDDDDD